MLLGNLDLLKSDPIQFVRLLAMVIFAMTIAITVHEFSHAFVAHRMGDDTAKRLGRLSFNPLVHLDPLGTILLLIIGFGWGKPVPVNTASMHRPVRWSMAAVSVAGACANVITAGIVGLLFRGIVDAAPTVLGDLLVYIVALNIMLAIFNLIPIPPLDGSNILAAVLPCRVMNTVWPVLRYAPFILLIVVVVDNVAGTGIVWHVLQWPVGKLCSLLMGFNPVA